MAKENKRAVLNTKPNLQTNQITSILSFLILPFESSPASNHGDWVELIRNPLSKWLKLASADASNVYANVTSIFSKNQIPEEKQRKNPQRDNIEEKLGA